MADPFEEQNVPQQEEQPRKRQRRHSSFSEWLKNLITLFVLLVVVVGSFWISFVLGKKILLPVRKLSVPTITTEPKTTLTPEKVEAAKPIKKEELAVLIPTLEVEVTPEVKVSVMEPATKVAVPKFTKRKELRIHSQVPSIKRYYKVSVGVLSSKTAAKELAAKLEAKGIPIYVKLLSDSKWRVQVGAFRTKTEAGSQAEAVKKHGFEASVLFE